MLIVTYVYYVPSLFQIIFIYCYSGENFPVTFQVTGNPAPEVEWNKGFKKIDAEEKMRNKFQAFTRGGPGEKNIIGLFVKEAKPDEEGDELNI